MANHVSALKRHKQDQKRRLRNKSYKSMVNTSVKKVVIALEEGDAEAAKASYKSAIAKLDSAAGKGILHKKTAARRISRLTKKLNASLS
ncbi:MAG: 30S ribosomal protein S20 [Deltaproteobacteria bacterium ADurb.Bin510]|nr:MAG: 30S ribosomal protein S20 [Deltaproteobacteria bacterium ADurb.Bin510]